MCNCLVPFNYSTYMYCDHLGILKCWERFVFGYITEWMWIIRYAGLKFLQSVCKRLKCLLPLSLSLFLSLSLSLSLSQAIEMFSRQHPAEASNRAHMHGKNRYKNITACELFLSSHSFTNHTHPLCNNKCTIKFSNSLLKYLFWPVNLMFNMLVAFCL